MLVLSRQKEEEIVLDFSQMTDAELQELRSGKPITFQITEMRGDKVRVGTEAPRSVGVHRREIWDAIRRDRAAAKKTTTVSTESVAAPSSS